MLRRCITCGCEKPHTAEFFHVHSKMKAGLLNRCKPCHSLIGQANKVRRAEATKANERARYLRTREKHQAACKKRYLARREEVLMQQAQHRRQNIEKFRAKSRAYYQSHGEECRARAKQWRTSNPELAAEASRRKRQNHPDKYRAIARFHAAKRRALRLGSPGSHTRGEFLDLLAETGAACAYCGISLTEGTATVDHVVALTRGGSDGIENIVPACMPCNNKKNARPAVIFLLERRSSSERV